MLGSLIDGTVYCICLQLPAESRDDFNILMDIVDVDASRAVLSILPDVVGHVRDYLSRLKVEQQKVQCFLQIV